ncbi:cyclin-dependent kinase inhibitor 5-like [Lotus japonicus]|uniref:cyclin-dependent kinase inhibitor 5-like n=1 Tax=Lotus japonicus TaxID=34305 RepID=UPI00258518C5|nr:cyclin-dependent kinase inhibitor 5-like [Lotus japonicus]
MGKYMKKSKVSAAVIMDSTAVGVRTRARTLALQKSPPPSPSQSDSSAYLQLRSRRLLKAPPLPRRQTAVADSPKTSSSQGAEKLGPEEENVDVAMEGSFGENLLELEGRDRSTRESTPCSLIRSSSGTHTPGSTTRQRTNQIVHQQIQRNIPTAREMDEFFAEAEKQQQKDFMDKYNFDIVNDVPLPGRYEWVSCSADL